MNRRHAAEIETLTATVRRLADLGAAITVLAIGQHRVNGEITSITDTDFTVRDAYGELHTIPFAELESVGTYNA